MWLIMERGKTQYAFYEHVKLGKWVHMLRNRMNFSTTLQCWVHMLRKSGRRAFYSLFFALLFLQYISCFLGYMTKWLIFEEFAIFLNHRILTGKWVDMLRIIQLSSPFPTKQENIQMFFAHKLIECNSEINRIKRFRIRKQYIVMYPGGDGYSLTKLIN